MKPTYIHLSDVDSTMTYAKQKVQEGVIINDTVITADRQFCGKGRWGRSWTSPLGNLYFTRVQHENTSWAPFDSIMALTLSTLWTVRAWGCTSARIKWPNDIVCDGKKLAGILVERFSHEGTIWVSMGLGINVNTSECEKNAISISELLHHPIPMNDLIMALITMQNTTFQKKATFFNEWMNELSWMIGKPLHTHRQQEHLSGIVSQIYQDGSLELILENGLTERLSC